MYHRYDEQQPTTWENAFNINSNIDLMPLSTCYTYILNDFLLNKEFTKSEHPLKTYLTGSLVYSLTANDIEHGTFPAEWICIL